ncbi:MULTISPECIES: hypothetical protein [Escherichia]|uniref:hypothetical protein n=1 Tax=Escherichia TaxID=561 RepID=UPI00197AAB3C|nr:hypothetical protein [Escherichia coli]EIX0014595.1 hypothetical protein [Escherichia coli]HCH7484038.1 hypothetical protein [Escherichia coli]
MSNQFRSKHDIHPLDPYIKWLANRAFMLVIWLSIIAVGVLLSKYYEQWNILPRFGSIGIMIGTLLTLSPLFADGIYLSQAKAFCFAGTDEDGKTSVTSEEGRKVSINILCGVVLIVISSAINAFGDLIDSKGGIEMSYGPEFWSAIGAIGAAVAAFLSYVVTKKSTRYQNESLIELKRKNKLDLLDAYAGRANGAALGQDDAEWTFAQFANIMLAMKTAKNEITKLSGESYLSQIDAKEYFKNILDHQILASFEKGAPPDAAYKPLGSIQSAMKIEPLWNENREFFCT